MTNPDVRQAMGRDDFERFHGSRKNKGLKKAAQRFERLPDGTYADDSVQRHWWTWQNSRVALAEQPAEPSQGWQAEALMLREQLHQERNTNELLRSQNDKDYWAWQGDGTDHLESMGNRMIVRIFASDLRHLLATSHPAPSVAVPEGREIKNQLAISGVIDAALNAVLNSNEPDEVRALIVGLAHASVDAALLAASPQPPTPQEVSSHPEFPDN